MGHMTVLGTWREPRAVAPRTILGAAVAASQPAFVSLATGRGTNQVTSLHHRVLKSTLWRSFFESRDPAERHRRSAT